jgi:hypothetical protein
MLAGLDDRSYQRALLRDSNGILERILLPMSFPWQHRVVPVARNIPCDIDEMPAILTSQDGSYTPFENGPLGFGKFDIGQLRRGASSARVVNSDDMVCAAARRAGDPGQVELSSVTLPPIQSEEHAIQENTSSKTETGKISSTSSSTWREKSDEDDIEANGEISLRCFEEVQRQKRRKVGQARSCVRRHSISVRVESTSSRTSIFDANSGPLDVRFARPWLTEATLPLEVQNGRFLSASNAKSIARKLGTYNLRHGLGTTNPSGKNSNRVSVGRTRLIWTEKSPSDQPQRVFFTSLLTGEKLEAGAQKRPREIRVGVRVNGSLLTASRASASPADLIIGDIDLITLPRHNRAMKVTARFMDDEITAAAQKSLQCALDSDQLVKNILKDAKKRVGFPDKERLSAGTLEYAEHVPPRIDCIPDNNGLISAICTIPGTLSPASGSIHDILNEAARRVENPTCTVCWSTSGSEKATVEECFGCGVTAHLGCCLDVGEGANDQHDGNDQVSESKWTCAVCSKLGHRQSRPDTDDGSTRKRRRESRLPPRLKDSHLEPLLSRHFHASASISSEEVTCALCPYSGGAMSRIDWGGERIWIHEVCRIWKPNVLKVADKAGQINERGIVKCALCGSGDGIHSTRAGAPSCVQTKLPCGLVKCAAARCQIHFHPMCALLASKLSITQPERRTTRGAVTGIASTDNGVSPLETTKMKDSLLCNEFTLTALKYKATKGAYGKNPGEKQLGLIPVAFCGIHNPKREQRFYGMYPKGLHMDVSTVRIPPSNNS